MTPVFFDRPRDFWDLQEQVFTRHDEGRYADALALVDEHEDRWPERADRTVFWRACLLCRLGRVADALDVLQAAADRGMWWSEHALKGDVDLEPLWSETGFQRLAVAMRARQEEATRRATPVLEVTPPEAWLAGEDVALPLLIGLHGRGEAVPAGGGPWRAAVELGWLVAQPQASTPISTTAYAWDDPARSEQEVLGHHARLLADYTVDPDRVVLAGFSQGGTLALRLALSGALPARGVIAVCPSGGAAAEQVASLVPQGAARRVRTYLVTGERDYALDSTRALGRALAAAGAPVGLVVEPHLGHRYPPDLPHVLERGLSFCSH